MEINYVSSRCLFYQFSLANRHFQVAFTSGSAEKIQDLWDQGVIRHAHSDSISLFGRLKHFLYGVTEYIPVIGLVIAFVDRYLNGSVSLPPNCTVKEAVKATPKFESYTFKGGSSVHLTDIDKRPANLLFDAIFGKDPTTQPGGPQLFAFPSATEAREHIMGLSNDTVISVSAKNKRTQLYRRGSDFHLISMGEKDLTTYLGNNTFEISAKELNSLLDSQKVYVSSLIPKKFYLGLKEAFESDEIVTLPGHDRKVPTVDEILTGCVSSLPSSNAYLQKVQANPSSYGFKSDGQMLAFEELKKLTLYQLGSMIVKTEDYYPLVEEGYRLAARKVGDKDAITLISASGIRGFFNTHQIAGNENHEIDRKIMAATFRTALQSIGKDGIAIFPAVGMGVWRGDPGIYWRAFFDAILEGGKDLKHIFVNPGHQTTLSGKYKGYSGEEFAHILNEYLEKHPQNKNLRKVIDLYTHKTDLFLLARNIKKQSPDVPVALFNASDPDVTLGNHVGEYVNNLCHTSTTEENYAAAGTSGLGFEQMTCVLKDPQGRVIQA